MAALRAIRAPEGTESLMASPRAPVKRSRFLAATCRAKSLALRAGGGGGDGDVAHGALLGGFLFGPGDACCAAAASCTLGQETQQAGLAHLACVLPAR